MCYCEVSRLQSGGYNETACGTSVLKPRVNIEFCILNKSSAPFPRCWVTSALAGCIFLRRPRKSIGQRRVLKR